MGSGLCFCSLRRDLPGEVKSKNLTPIPIVCQAIGGDYNAIHRYR